MDNYNAAMRSAQTFGRTRELGPYPPGSWAPSGIRVPDYETAPATGQWDAAINNCAHAAATAVAGLGLPNISVPWAPFGYAVNSFENQIKNNTHCKIYVGG